MLLVKLFHGIITSFRAQLGEINAANWQLKLKQNNILDKKKQNIISKFIYLQRQKFGELNF